MKKKVDFWTVTRLVVIFAGLILAIGPLFWMFLTSFKTRQEVLFSFPPTIFPKKFTLTTYPSVFNELPFARYLFNTLMIAIPSTVLSMVMATMAAYALARIRFKGATALLFIILAAQMFPGSSIMIPTFIVIQNFGLYNRIIGLVLLYSTMALPLSVWMLYGYLRKVPIELEEAAWMDGAGRMKTLRIVMLPLIAPGVAAVGTFSFLVAWNEFTYALVMIRSPELYTVSLGLARYITEFATYYDEMAAASIIACIPVLAIYVLLGKSMISGLAAGAVKG